MNRTPNTKIIKNPLLEIFNKWKEMDDQRTRDREEGKVMNFLTLGVEDDARRSLLEMTGRYAYDPQYKKQLVEALNNPDFKTWAKKNSTEISKIAPTFGAILSQHDSSQTRGQSVARWMQKIGIMHDPQKPKKEQEQTQNIPSKNRKEKIKTALSDIKKKLPSFRRK